MTPVTLACGETTFSATIADPAGTHKVSNMYLVVDDGVVQNVKIPVDGNSVSITVGPYFSDKIISWRVWGGDERDYDLPLWNGYGGATFSIDINNYGSANGWSWVIWGGVGDPNPFTTWNRVSVTGCPLTKDRCKDGGWEALGFTNQGLCIKEVNEQQHSTE